MKVVDTNVFLRYFTNDVPAKAVASRQFLFDLGRTSQAYVTESVLAEVVYVMLKVYKATRKEIVDSFLPVLAVNGLVMDDKAMIFRALQLFSNHSYLDFEDALTVAHMERRGITEIVSYDLDFDRIEGIKRVEP